MKILMIVPQPFFQSRGTPFSVYFRTRTLSRLGHEVDIVTYPIGSDVAIPNVRILRTMKVPGINKIKIGPSLPKLILDIPLFFKTFGLLLKNRYDMVHAHEEGMFMCLVYKIFFPRMKILYDMHSSLPQQLRNFKFTKSKLLIKSFEWLENLSLKAASGVITICPDLQRTVDDLRVTVPNVMIENTLFDSVDYADKREDQRAEPVSLKSLEGKKVVLYSGTFEAYQGLPMLIEGAPSVLARRPDTVFLMVGGAPEQVEAMKKLAAEKNVAHAVLFTGNLPPNATKAYIKRADILVSPRMKGTNTPLKIYEYLASGKAIVATRHPTHTQVLTDREAILAEPNAAAFAAGVLEALENPARAAEVIEGAAALYKSAYAPELYYQRLGDLLGRMGHRNGTVAPAAAAVEAR